MRIRVLIAVGLLWIAVPLGLEGKKPFDQTARKQLIALLNDLCQWLTASSAKGEPALPGSGPVNPLVSRAVAARALTLGYELTKENSQYLQEALRHTEALTAMQRTIKTSKGNDGGYWLESASQSDLDLAVNGTIAAALTRASADADGPLKKRIQDALKRYAYLVQEGCSQDFLGKGRGGSPGWVIRDREQKGAIGAGYLKDVLSTKASTLATASNAAFFAQLYAIDRNAQYRDLAENAVRWLLQGQNSTGYFPTLVDGVNTYEASMETLMAGTEAVLAVYYLCSDNALNQQIHKDIEPTVRWLVRTQNEKGLWGNKKDQRGCTSALTLLAWYYQLGTKDEAFLQSLDKGWQILSNPVHAQSFGVQISPYTTALMAITTAEAFKPGISFKKF
jgi:hypothetical protein